MEFDVYQLIIFVGRVCVQGIGMQQDKGDMTLHSVYPTVSALKAMLLAAAPCRHMHGHMKLPCEQGFQSIHAPATKELPPLVAPEEYAGCRSDQSTSLPGAYMCASSAQQALTGLVNLGSFMGKGSFS